MKNKYEENVEYGFADYEMIRREMIFINCLFCFGYIVI